MSRSGIIRLVAVLASVIAGVLSGGASASASVPPVVNWYSATNIGFNQLEFNAEINPSGEPTSYEVEYGTTSSLGSSTPSQNIGAGTSPVVVHQLVTGLNPHQGYYYRFYVYNEHRAVTTKTKFMATAYFRSWYGEYLMPQSYHSTGTFTLEGKGLGLTITCTENGSGVIGNVGGIGDEYNLTLSKCSVAGAPKCKVTIPAPMHLAANFKSTAPTELTVEMDPATCAWFSMTFASKPFTVPVPPIGPTVTESMSLTQSTSFGANPITIKDTSSWSLSGAVEGSTFSTWW
jgi:hypothetical protein